MLDFKNEIKEFKDEMLDFKNEMKEFKVETRDFKEEMRQDRQEMNRQWGNLANKMGTVVEDLIVPGVKSVIKKYFKEEIIDFAVNRSKKKNNVEGEYDVIAASKTSLYLVETKTSPNQEKLDDFKNKMTRFKKLFPEFRDLKLVPIFATIRFEEKFIPKVTAAGFYTMAYRDWEYMDLLNFEEISNRK